MKHRKRERFVPEYKARRRARERSAFMLEMARAQLEAVSQWLERGEPRMPLVRFTTLADLGDQGPVPPPGEGTPPGLH